MLPSTEAFNQTTRLWLSLRPDDLQLAVETPDQRQLLKLPAKTRGLAIRLYLKSLEGARPRYILVATSEKEGGLEIIFDAWYLPKHLVPDDPTPLDALASLCKTFGLRVRIAGLVDRLIYSRTITPRPGEAPNLRLEVLDQPSRGKVKPSTFFKVNDDGSIDVALACAIDAFALKRKPTG